MWTEEQLQLLPGPLQALFQRLERDTVDKICARVKAIGNLTSSDLHALEELTSIGADISSIRRDMEKTLEMSERMVYDLFYEAAQTDYNFQREVFEKLGEPWIPFDQNPAAYTLVESVARVTAGEIRNMTLTTGFTNRAGEWEQLAKYYQDTVDYCVLQVRSGVTDYYSALRQAVKELSDNGLQHIEYDNVGKRYYRRRADSSVRNAFMGGQSRLSRQIAALQGELIGADGMEISWHGGARPSHVAFAGKQFNMAEYERVCVPLLEDFNCYHRAFPIVLGVSPLTYTQEQLNELNAQDRVKRSFEGKEYNRYEAAQMQRRMETAIRREKDRAKAFAAAGDTDAERVALAKTAALNRKYKEFSGAMELTPKANRTTVVNFSRSQAAKYGWAGRTIANSNRTRYNILMDASKGSRNHGLLVKLSEQTDTQLQKSITSYVKNVKEHYAKIANPAAFVEDWASRSNAYKTGIIKKWEKDIARNREQLDIARRIAAERKKP